MCSQFYDDAIHNHVGGHKRDRAKVSPPWVRSAVVSRRRPWSRSSRAARLVAALRSRQRGIGLCAADRGRRRRGRRRLRGRRACQRRRDPGLRAAARASRLIEAMERGFHLPGAPRERVRPSAFGDGVLGVVDLSAREMRTLLTELRARRRRSGPSGARRRNQPRRAPFPRRRRSAATSRADRVAGGHRVFDADDRGRLAERVRSARRRHRPRGDRGSTGACVALLGIVAAGNVPGVALARAALALDRRRVVHRQERVRRAASRSTLRRGAGGAPIRRWRPRSPSLGGREGPRRARQEFLRGIDSLVAYGSDDAIESLAARGPRRFVGHRHKLSIGLVPLKASTTSRDRRGRRRWTWRSTTSSAVCRRNRSSRWRVRAGGGVHFVGGLSRALASCGDAAGRRASCRRAKRSPSAACATSTSGGRSAGKRWWCTAARASAAGRSSTTRLPGCGRARSTERSSSAISSRWRTCAARSASGCLARNRSVWLRGPTQEGRQGGIGARLSSPRAARRHAKPGSRLAARRIGADGGYSLRGHRMSAVERSGAG